MQPRSVQYPCVLINGDAVFTTESAPYVSCAWARREHSQVLQTSRPLPRICTVPPSCLEKDADVRGDAALAILHLEFTVQLAQPTT